MLIDWFTVGAQVLNFAILVWLMKRFLYKPVLDAIAAREARIAATLADADRKQAEAQHDRDEFQRKNDRFDSERAALLAQAGADAAVERERLMTAARAAADALAVKRQEALAGQAQSLSEALSRRAQTEVFAIARQTLADLADASLEASACGIFIERLRGLHGDDRDAFASALTASACKALVRSAFALPEPQRAAVRNAVNETFSIAAELRFDTAPDLVSGIELSAHGQKFAWSISDHLAALDRAVTELLRAPAAIVLPNPT